jgi:hypothetical protein
MPMIERVHGRVLRRMQRRDGRQKTLLIELFKLRSVARTGSAVAAIPSPSHETCLPRRPPRHWLKPPRVSVVNALLPWQIATAAEFFRPHDRDPGTDLAQ